MIDKDIQNLANEVLDKEDMQKIEAIINDFQDLKSVEKAKHELMALIGAVPKRPLYYVVMHMDHLPKHGTRDVIRYLGDYIDQLVRFTLEDKKFLARWFQNPLGPNIEKLKKYIDIKLYNHLKIFNIIYTQAKHDFNHYEDKSLFDYEDVVYVTFIVKKLAAQLLFLSERARDYNSHGKTFYRYNPVD